MNYLMTIFMIIINILFVVTFWLKVKTIGCSYRRQQCLSVKPFRPSSSEYRLPYRASQYRNPNQRIRRHTYRIQKKYQQLILLLHIRHIILLQYLFVHT